MDVGRNVVHNAREMEKQNIVAGPYWFSIYTTFCATLSLSFFIWENSDVQGSLQTLKDAEYGRDVLVRLAYKSKAAARHAETLAVSLEVIILDLKILLTITQTIFNRLPEKLGKSQRNQSKAQKKRHTPILNQDDGHNCPGPGNIDIETTYNSSEYSLEAKSSTHSRTSPPTIETMSLREPSLPEGVRSPSKFPTISKTLPQRNFYRFLGPDSIEDLFRPESESSGDFVHANIDSSLASFSQNFDSLDQYVSSLEMQEGQQRPDGMKDLTSNGSLPAFTSPENAIFDARGVDPFIPLSPYLMQVYSPTGNHLLPSELSGMLADEYFMVDQCSNTQEARLQ